MYLGLNKNILIERDDVECVYYIYLFERFYLKFEYFKCIC